MEVLAASTTMANVPADSMDLDMDIDIDLNVDPYEGEASTIRVSESTPAPPTTSQPNTSTSDIELLPNKIHLQGLDHLSSKDVKEFTSEHFSIHQHTSIEWINDTSANIVYETAEIASQALQALSHESIDGSPNALQLRDGKAFTLHPDSHIQLRIAVATDKKAPRARDASRYYLLHPEEDPRERRRKDSGERGGRRRYGLEEHRRRRRKDEEEGFTASMYDDDQGVIAERRGHGSRSSISSGSARGEYHPLRSRSASPARDGDSASRKNRRRTPPPQYRSRDPHPFPRENREKELFPAARDGKTVRKELFPNQKAASSLKKELFPTKHHRTKAFDAADETADLFSTGMQVPLVDGSSDGRLRMTDPDPDPESMASFDDAGFSIRGSAAAAAKVVVAQQSKGFSIRGAAAGNGTKELFPVKANNAGKELFGQKLDGRGGARNKASDLFG